MVNRAFALDTDGNFVMREPDPVGLPGILEPELAEDAAFLVTVARIRLEAELGTVRLHRDLGIPQRAWMVVDAAPVLQTLVVSSLSRDPSIRLINLVEVETLEAGDARLRQVRCLVNVSGDDGSSADVVTEA